MVLNSEGLWNIAGVEHLWADLWAVASDCGSCLAQLGMPVVASVGEENDVRWWVVGAVADGDGIEYFVAVYVEGSAAAQHDISPGYLACLASRNDCSYL